MIRTIGELLNELAKQEQIKIQAFLGIGHQGLIGDMYEGLAQTIAARAIPSGLNLRVVHGKIRNSKGDFSRQIDCMLVEGKGDQLPNTDHWIYPIQQVVAVMEVKKTLYGDELGDAIDLFIDLWKRIAEPKAMPASLLRDAWGSIIGTELPSREQVSNLSPELQIMFHTLTVEANLPVRIILGFDGFKNEATLRQGLIDLLEKRVDEAKKSGGAFSGGPLAMPNLIIGREASLLKLNGMPYGTPFDVAKSKWSFFASRGRKPLDIFLEQIWTRLCYYHGVSSSIFGDDLEVEGVHPLLEGSIVVPRGWELHWLKMSEEELNADADTTDWEPTRVSAEAFCVLNLLCSDQMVLVDAELKSFLQSQSRSLADLEHELVASRLVFRNGDRFELLTKECACVVDPDLGFVAAENNSGRLTRWVMKRIDERGKKSSADNGTGAPDEVGASTIAPTSQPKAGT